MRLTRDTLLKIARDTAAQRVRVSRRIICIYLTGSLLNETPLLGGTTDIDLVMIHDSEPIQPREIVRLSDEIHLDIAHYPQSLFRQPRHLRSHPWLGPFIYSKPIVFHDTAHWFDFTQAATGAQFFQPDYIFQRASSLSQAARQSWMALAFNPTGSHPQQVFSFLETLENAGNALVCLTGEGDPLPERRFLLQFPQRLQELNRPDLVAGLNALLVDDADLLENAWPEWLSHWKETYRTAGSQEEAPPRLHPARHLYYERAAAALWDENPDAAVWLLYRPWTLAASRLSDGDPALSSWDAASQVLGFDTGHFPERLEKLDRYLDSVEETLDSWANKNGISVVPEI